jgi:hypothetical protein
MLTEEVTILFPSEGLSNLGFLHSVYGVPGVLIPEAKKFGA